MGNFLHAVINCARLVDELVCGDERTNIDFRAGKLDFKMETRFNFIDFAAAPTVDP